MREIASSFHNKMPIQLVHIVKLLEVAANDCCGNKEEISSITGIPTGDGSGKVVPHIEFAKSMGLIDYEKEKAKFKLFLTPLGECVYEQDPYMLEDVTKWMCNYWLTDELVGIPQWYYFLRYVPVSYEQEEDLAYIEEKVQEKFNTKVNMAVTYHTYLADCFEELNLIRYKKSEKKVIFNHLGENLVNKYVYAYTLLKSWEMRYPTLQEITINQVINEIRWGRAYGLGADEVTTILDELAQENIITLNKQLTPMTLIKTHDAEKFLARIYDLVF